MKVLLTGVSSFTGAHIARALKDAGHQVWGVLTGARQDPESRAPSLRETRLQFSGVEHWVENAAFGNEAFLGAIQEVSPEIIINHGADIKGYRLPSFDVSRSVASSTFGAKDVFDLAHRVGVRRFIHSGTVFEPHDQLLAKSVYGESKSQVAQLLSREAERVKLPFSKIFIPNPIGALENEDRLIPVFVSKWKNGETPHLGPAVAVSDHIPAEWLAQFYVQEVEREESSPLVLRQPTAFRWSNQELVDRFVSEAQNFGVKLNLEYTLGAPTAAGEPPRLGNEECAELGDPAKNNLFWKEWIEHHFN